MREAGFLGLMMVFAEIARGVKELLGNDWRLNVNFFRLVEDRLIIDATARAVCGNVLECSPRGVETAISALKQQSHVGRNDSVGAAGGIIAFLSRTNSLYAEFKSTMRPSGASAPMR